MDIACEVLLENLNVRGRVRGLVVERKKVLKWNLK